MNKSLIFSLIIFIGFNHPDKLNAQTFSGKIYGPNSTAKHIKIKNMNSGKIAFSDDDGNFNIQAASKDTIKFSSVFYEEKYMLISPSLLNKTNVIHLKEKVNLLKEVTVRSEQIDKNFDPKEYNEALINSIKEDIKNHPEKYGSPPGSSPDLVKIIGLVAKLFRKKHPSTTISPIKSQQLDSLFLKSPLFNDKLLTNELHLDTHEKYLFFLYCEQKNLDDTLLKEKHQFLLLDKLIEISKEFNMLKKEE